jgi:hypothetical protein
MNNSKEYNDVETTLNRIQAHKGVQGMLLSSIRQMSYEMYLMPSMILVTNCAFNFD